MKKKKKNSRQFNKKFRQQFFTPKSGIIIGLTCVIILFLGIGSIRQKKQADRYRETISELSSEVKQIEETNQALEEEKENTNTDEFKERIAREKLGLIGKDEYAVMESDDEEGSPEADSSGESTGN